MQIKKEKNVYVVYCLIMLQEVNYKHVEELDPLVWEFKANVNFSR